MTGRSQQFCAVICGQCPALQISALRSSVPRVPQALPYCWTLFFVPAHFTTFELLLLATGVWTTSIHDTIDAQASVDQLPFASSAHGRRERRSCECISRNAHTPLNTHMSKDAP